MNPSTPSPAIDLYLDLLKKSLTNNIFAEEPDEEVVGRFQFLSGFVQHYIKGPSVSMLPLARFDSLQFCIADVLRNEVPGDLIETGVWRGGATIFMRAALAAYEDPARQVWVADSFEGLPKPDAEKYPIEAQVHEGPFMARACGHLAVSLEEVKRNFEAYGMLDNRVRFLKGWFKDTLPLAPIEKLSIMRLDGDFYESTMDSLTNLYDKLSVGGYAIIDDYGEDSWTYCRKAVEDFRRDRRIEEPMIKVDPSCYYWQRLR
jgi:hypothetical protein